MTLPPPLLSAQGVTVRARDWDIVAGVDLDLYPGEILALLGPNGAGKTTLLRALLGFTPMEMGSVSAAGQALPQLSARARARMMAYVPQHSHLAARLSARAVVEIGRYPHRGDQPGLSRHDQAVVDQALTDTDCRYLSERSFVACSGGEQARLLLARALATEAPCLLLDEPAANLDVAHALDLYALLRRLADAGKGILIVVHDLEHALRWADRAILLEEGRAVASGAVHSVITEERVAAVYRVRMQHGAGLGFSPLEHA